MKVDLVKYLESVFHGRVKPMITTCSMRAMYADNKDPTVAAAIGLAKGFERRRCGHLMDQPAESEMACVMSVVDGKKTGRNVNRLCIGTQDEDLRRRLRQIPFVPMCYSKRSVMILEPASAATTEARARDEKSKFRDGLKTRKRKREARDLDNDDKDDDDDAEGGGARVAQKNVIEPEEHEIKRKRRAVGPKGPNPLSMKKAKKKLRPEEQGKKEVPGEPSAEEPTESHAKRKRRKKKQAEDGGEEQQQSASEGQAIAPSAAAQED